MPESFFPQARPRRLRRSASMRQLVRETMLAPEHLIAPLFVTESAAREPVASMPGVERVPVESVAADAVALFRLGVRAVVLFGIPAIKDAAGSQSFASDGVTQRAVRAIKAAVPELAVITDVCLCEYTDHGHCGVLAPDGTPLNDATLPVLGRIAVSHARAGADVVAPSGMMDGMVGSIRTALDTDGHPDVAVLSYSVKYASAFYGPFRDAAATSLLSGDRRTHQMDPANAREALREADLDVAEGADMLMVKPALAYLDVVHALRAQHPSLPLVAYQVSGEYAMLKAAAANGWLDERATVLETLISIRRAGADAIITYFAGDVARWLRDE
ncbi:MAG TPA: porphobilinogen synthase [Gemmatimonadaceae bacterium]|nr:porphobilinogen synthase [Gemmatimonadaceae bacterium]